MNFNYLLNALITFYGIGFLIGMASVWGMALSEIFKKLEGR